MTLRDARGRPAALSELLLAFASALAFSFLMLLDPGLSVISGGGLLDRVGDLTSVLTGFFVAALVAISAFTMDNSALDEEIKIGKVFDHVPEPGDVGLTRRQYICYMFGYLVGISFTISALAALVVSFSAQILVIYSYISNNIEITKGGIPKELALVIWKFISTFIIVFFFIHVILVSLRGIYYLMDKMYDKKPKLLKKRRVGRMPLERAED